MIRFAILVLCLCVSGLPSGLFAQSAEVWGDTEVVVEAKRPAGPALWRIKKGESEVIILGILPVFPKAQTWRPRRLENALRGAKALITPPANRTGLSDMVRVMSSKNLPDRQALKDVLPPDLYERFIATAKRAGISPKAFARDKPVWAGARLRREVLEKRRLTDDEPVETIARLAHKQSVPVRPAARYKTGPILKDMNLLSDSAGHACLRYTLDDIDFNMDRAPKAAAAWAVGDIKTVRANYQGGALTNCLQGSEVGAEVMARSVDDIVAAISGALQTSGKTVVIVQLSPLLRKGGALDRLRAQGYTITAPND